MAPRIKNVPDVLYCNVAGGMGFVVAAKHIDLGESVALKFLRREALVHDELMLRFATEARAAVRIKSEHVARVFDVGNLPDGVQFVQADGLALAA